MKPPYTIGAFLLIAMIASAIVAYSRVGAVPREAERIVSICASESGRAECYERNVPEMLSDSTLVQVFDVIRQIRSLDPAYQFCHVLAHKLGERVVAEDPSKWIDAIPQNPPDGLCSNGFIHGVIGGRFRAEVLEPKTLKTLMPDFAKACASRKEWRASDLDRAMCSHGMGHLYMFVTDADIPVALSLCEDTMPEGLKRVCREGVFMQIYQPLEPDDYLLIERMPIKPTKETVRSFCARYSKDEYEGACLRESWPFSREQLETGKGVARFCSGQPNADEERACYESAFSLAGRFMLGNPTQAISLCADAPGQWKSMCYASGARAILEEERTDGEKAVAFCKGAPSADQEWCLTQLADTANFTFGNSPERKPFCSLLPQDMRSRCMGQP